MNDDQQQLDLLATFHYVVAGITALIGCFPIIHLAIGIAILSGAIPHKPDETFLETLFGALFAGVAAMMILAFWALALFVFSAGRLLKQRRRHTFCLVVAGVHAGAVRHGPRRVHADRFAETVGAGAVCRE
jgi:hypothetical protein